MLQQDAGMGMRGPPTPAGFSAQVAAQMAAPNFFANPSVTSAAAAAAASAVQSLMAGALAGPVRHLPDKPDAMLEGQPLLCV